MVYLKLDRTHVNTAVPEIFAFYKRFISKHFHMKDIFPVRDIIEFGDTFGVSEGEIADGRVLRRNHIKRREGNRLVRQGVNHRGMDLCHPAGREIVIDYEYLCPGLEAEGEESDGQ